MQSDSDADVETVKTVEYVTLDSPPPSSAGARSMASVCGIRFHDGSRGLAGVVSGRLQLGTAPRVVTGTPVVGSPRAAAGQSQNVALGRRALSVAQAAAGHGDRRGGASSGGAGHPHPGPSSLLGRGGSLSRGGMGGMGFQGGDRGGGDHRGGGAGSGGAGHPHPGPSSLLGSSGRGGGDFSDERLLQLIDMGFNAHQSADAVVMTRDGDVQAAVDVILQNDNRAHDDSGPSSLLGRGGSLSRGGVGGMGFQGGDRGGGAGGGGGAGYRQPGPRLRDLLRLAYEEASSAPVVSFGVPVDVRPGPVADKLAHMCEGGTNRQVLNGQQLTLIRGSLGQPVSQVVQGMSPHNMQQGRLGEACRDGAGDNLIVGAVYRMAVKLTGKCCVCTAEAGFAVDQGKRRKAMMAGAVFVPEYLQHANRVGVVMKYVCPECMERDTF